MPTETVLLDLIDDNPHNPRQSYSVTRVKEMAQSLLQLGQIETPKARKVDGRYQLVSGHLRLRGLRLNQKKTPPTTPAEMRLEVFPLTDDEMYFAAVEENLRRHELTPLDLAKSVDAYLKVQPATTETEVGKKLGFTVGHVSNMRRVLRLPASMLDKINEGKISFTQGRELLVMEALDGAEEHMKSAYGKLKVGNKQWGEPNTVAGIQTAVYEVVRDNCRPLGKQFGGYQWTLLFNPKAAGCDKCEHTIKVVPQKGKSALFCTNAECWEKHQEDQRQAAAAEARERVRKEVVSTVAEETALQEESTDGISERIAAAPAPILYTLEKRGNTWLAIDGQGRIIAIRSDKKDAASDADNSFVPVEVVLDPSPQEFLLNHTYRVIPQADCPKAPPSPDVVAQDLPAALAAMQLEPREVKEVKVHRSSGKIGTDGGVSAGWSKCTEPMEAPDQTAEFYKERDLGQSPDGHLRTKMLGDMEGEYPCKSCPLNDNCDLSHVYVDGHKNYQCAERDKPPETPPSAREEIILDEAMFGKARASYSADKIAAKESMVRRPFVYEDVDYISTGGASGGASGISKEECYHLAPVEEYHGETRTYNTPPGYQGDYLEDRRNDPLGFYNGMLVSKGTKVLVGPPVTFRLAAEELAQEKAPEIPEEVLAKAREKAGTRAVILDMMEISTGPKYNPQFKQGFASLTWERKYLDDFEECSERCTTGFHFAFDSRDDKPKAYLICSNPECLKKKKTARTRRLNAAGQDNKKREQRGVKAAIASTTALDHGRMSLILYTQLKGYHIETWRLNGAKTPEIWLWDKVSPGIKSHERTSEKLWKAVDKLSEEAVAKLIVEFCFYALTDHGNVGDHKIKAKEQLRWLGITLEEEKSIEKGSDATSSRRRGRGKAKTTEADETPVSTKEN